MKPCAIVVPNGPAFARSGSTWIHWWSPVASANWSIRFCVTSIQSLTSASPPTSFSSSASVAYCFISALVHPRDDRLPLLAVALESGRRDVPQRQTVRSEMDVILRVAQEPEQGDTDAVEELAQLVGRNRPFACAHADDRGLHLR